MPLNRDRAQKYLQKFDFESLFIKELGWDTVDRVTLPFAVDGESFEVVAIAQKRGIQSKFDRTWYASLMLNRLMFVYFIQKKNFLDGDSNYLRNRLKRCQAEWGTDTFHSFYRQFLLKLFHEGLGKPGRNPELDQLLGRIPYLNGGLFEAHQLEEKYDRTLQIPDAAFEQVFNFFDEYDWHLDDRPLRNQNEINPDVLGYIFEKYINQKQMGAYYTKEDITEYISKNTIIPFLFDAAKKRCPAAFRPHPLTPSPKQGEGEPDDSLAPLSLGRGAGGEGRPRYDYFRKVLAEMAKHPNPRYFVLKSIILNNLYGVDIMEEATEICKLRLFLKLVAQMEAQSKQANFGPEPLPDIDFNIRAGNTLVGFASLDEVRKAISQDEVKSKKAKGKGVEIEADQFKLDLQDDANRINEKAELADRAFQRFRQMQTERVKQISLAKMRSLSKKPAKPTTG